nr:hypothetical protein [Tanacetum cinerariifolium]
MIGGGLIGGALDNGSLDNGGLDNRGLDNGGLDNGGLDNGGLLRASYLLIKSLNVLDIDSNKQDTLCWKDIHGEFQSFSVRNAWEDVRPRGAEVTWVNIVWFSHCVP